MRCRYVYNVENKSKKSLELCFYHVAAAAVIVVIIFFFFTLISRILTGAMLVRCRRCFVCYYYSVHSLFPSLYTYSGSGRSIANIYVFATMFGCIFFCLSLFVIYLFDSSFSVSFFSCTMFCDIGRNLFDAIHSHPNGFYLLCHLICA